MVLASMMGPFKVKGLVEERKKRIGRSSVCGMLCWVALKKRKGGRGYKQSYGNNVRRRFKKVT